MKAHIKQPVIMRNKPEASGGTDIRFPFFNHLKTYTITVINSMFVFWFLKRNKTMSIGSNLCGTTCDLDMGGLFSILTMLAGQLQVNLPRYLKLEPHFAYSLFLIKYIKIRCPKTENSSGC